MKDYFMLRKSYFFLFIFLTLSAFSWSQIFPNHIEFGDVSSKSTRFKDVKIENTNAVKSYVLRVDAPKEIKYILSSDVIQPNSFITIRIQVNPTKSGEFSHTIKVHLSSNTSGPLDLKITGNCTEPISNQSYLTNCPDFNSTPPNNAFSPKKITIITVDKITHQPLSRSKVSIIHNGIPAGTWITGSSGSFKDQFPPGYFYFLASHDGYENKEAGVYINPEITEVTIPLIRKNNPVDPLPEIPKDTIDVEAEKIPETQIKSQLDEQLKAVQQTPIPTEIPELSTVDPTNFSEEYFQNIQVEFVLDISSSMKMGEKMDLLKYALNQLIQVLRPNDKMGIVTYANTANVFLSPTIGSSKELIAKAVAEIKPLGMTAGGKGIKLGFKEAKKMYDPTKKNMVIVITDGAFNRDSDDYQKVVKKYASKGIQMSVVGIQVKEKDAVLMEEAAAFGKGRYIPINKLADAHSNLVHEIKIASFKKK